MRIAIVGAGISGMVAAYLLAGDHEVVVFEANDYAGGHTRTVDVQAGRKEYAVDTGFIVFNEKTYPNFVKLLHRLGVKWQPSKMSFSVKCDQTGMEYSPSTLNSLFAQRRHFVSPKFLRMLTEIFRFRRGSLELLKDQNDQKTLGAYLMEKKYSKMFRDKFILPMGAAIWSSDPVQFEGFPGRFFVQFFHNHGFLKVRDKPPWLVIQGGSRNYVKALTKSYAGRIRLKCPIESVERHEDHVVVKPKGSDADRFDHLIIATHSDQALSMLSDPSEAEREILSSIPYQENLTVLHTDKSLLPQHRSCWSSWNYFIPRECRQQVALTYDMNILQGLDAPVAFCVTLNRPFDIHPSHLLQTMVYHHPCYTPKGIAAQKRRGEISGIRRTHYCGAYWSYGFHEDGVNSALSVCKYFGKGF